MIDTSYLLCNYCIYNLELKEANYTTTTCKYDDSTDESIRP